MKMKKINLEELGQSLSRSEMKEVMAGSGGSGCAGPGELCFGHWQCCDDLICDYWIGGFKTCEAIV